MPARTNTTTPAPARQNEPDPIVDAIGGIAGLLWAAVSGVAQCVWFAAASTTSALAWLVKQSTTGKHRHLLAPFWLAGLATGSVWLAGPGAAWYWVILAVAAEVSLWRRTASRSEWRVLSERERRLVACTLAGLALVADVLPTAGAPLKVTVGALVGTCLAGAVPWWRWRVRKTKRPEILDRWENEVVTQDDRFAGEWKEFDDVTGVGFLRLANAPASVVAKLDADAEFHLDAPAGTVTISDVPGLSRREVKVVFSRPGEVSRFRFWEGPTLDRSGKLVALHAPGDDPIRGTLWTRDGASFIAIIAPPGTGKGSIQRVLILEAAICPDIFTVGIDGKRGKGLGYCRAGFDVFAKTPAEWRTALDMLIAEMERRSEDGDEADGFVLRPGTPRIFTAIDDLPEVIAACPAAGRQLNRMSAQCRSLGMGLAVAAQKGDAPTYGGALIGTTTRSNILGNGWQWVGLAQDSQARTAAKQGFALDFSKIPNEKGWAALMGAHLGDQPITAGRTLWIPNRNDVAEFGMEAPFGVVEDWLERDTIHPAICDEMAAIFRPSGETQMVAEVAPAVEALADEPVPTDGWSRILRVLATKPEGMLRGEIASSVGLTPRRVSQLVTENPGRVVQAADKKWRLAS